MKTGIAEMVRVYAKTVGRFRPAEAARQLNIERDQVNVAVRDLVNRGDLVRPARGIYEYADREGAYRPGEKMQALWKAMRLSATWTVRQVSRHAGVTTNYASKLVQRWRREGLVENVGRRTPEHGAGKESVYRLKDRSRLIPPHVVEPEEDPVKKKAWSALGRILLGRVAMPGEREKCMAELAELIDALKKTDKEEGDERQEG